MAEGGARWVVRDAFVNLYVLVVALSFGFHLHDEKLVPASARCVCPLVCVFEFGEGRGKGPPRVRGCAAPTAALRPCKF